MITNDIVAFKDLFWVKEYEIDKLLFNFCNILKDTNLILF